MLAPEITFNRSSLLGGELEYIFETMTVGQIAWDRTYSKKCHAPARTNAGCSESTGY
jgi:hypothetical protein